MTPISLTPCISFSNQWQFAGVSCWGQGSGRRAISRSFFGLLLGDHSSGWPCYVGTASVSLSRSLCLLSSLFYPWIRFPCHILPSVPPRFPSPRPLISLLLSGLVELLGFRILPNGTVWWWKVVALVSRRDCSLGLYGFRLTALSASATVGGCAGLPFLGLLMVAWWVWWYFLVGWWWLLCGLWRVAGGCLCG